MEKPTEVSGPRIVFWAFCSEAQSQLQLERTDFCHEGGLILRRCVPGIGNPGLCLWLALAHSHAMSFTGPTSLRAYPLLSVITRQPAVISHLVPATPGIAQALSHHPAAEATSAEAPGAEVLGSSESETEQPTPRQKKPRRSRTIFTELQLMGLEKKFQKQKYLSTPDR
ncbi:hypothetical protein MC885_017111 [Smutsia gigantea]|nr:hypothetical protein MC885_017111 [Smutsia gigantea]